MFRGCRVDENVIIAYTKCKLVFLEGQGNIKQYLSKW